MVYWGDRSPAGGRTLQVHDLSQELRTRGHQVWEIDARRPRELVPALRRPVDIVHSHGGLSTVVALMFRGRRNIPSPRRVVTLHGWHHTLTARMENALEGAAMLRYDAVTVPNSAMLNELPARVAVRASVVPNGVAPVPAPAVTPSHGTVSVLWLGRVCREKGIATALEAFTQARATCPTLRLDVAGPLEDAHARDLAHDPPTGVSFHGHVNHPWSKFAPHMLLHTPHYDASPRSVIEAFGADVPVVATRVGGIPSIVAHAANGLLAADGDISTLASHLVALASDPRLAGDLSRGGRRAFEEQHTIALMGARMEATYESVLG